MATARELLEQADALMRRNRANALDDIPVLTDALPAADLRHVVPVSVARPVVDPGPPSVPLLTEDIEVVDEGATVGADAIEGEPSAWLEFEDADPSVIGDAPDSVAIVPPFERRAVAPDEALIASAEHEEIELTLPSEEAPAAWPPAETIAPVMVDDAVRAAIDDSAAAAVANDADDAAALAAEVDDAAAAHAADAAALAADAADAADDFADAAGEDAAAPASFAPFVPAPATMQTTAPALAPPMTSAAMLAAAASLRMSQPPIAAQPAVESAPAPVLSMSNDDERWVAVAEEIRMQVLQRIDLFTDAGLRDQLALRLQPIADRASADFVAAINLHVGDLLRTYVAEAIEREIERWRRDH